MVDADKRRSRKAAGRGLILGRHTALKTYKAETAGIPMVDIKPGDFCLEG